MTGGYERDLLGGISESNATKAEKGHYSPASGYGFGSIWAPEHFHRERVSDGSVSKKDASVGNRPCFSECRDQREADYVALLFHAQSFALGDLRHFFAGVLDRARSS